MVRSWTAMLALACLLQAGAIVVLVATSHREVAAPARAEPASECLAVLQRIERRLDERLHAAPATAPASTGAAPVRAPAEVAARVPAIDEQAAQIEELRRLTATFASVATTLAEHEGAWLLPLGELAASHPEPVIANLAAFASACDGPLEEATCRRWFFRPARDVLTTFGRPTSYEGDSYWRYDFAMPDGSDGNARFRVVAGVVVHCEGDVR